MKPSTNKQFLRDCYGRRSLDSHQCQSTKYLLKLCYTPKTCFIPSELEMPLPLVSSGHILPNRKLWARQINGFSARRLKIRIFNPLTGRMLQWSSSVWSPLRWRIDLWLHGLLGWWRVSSGWRGRWWLHTSMRVGGRWRRGPLEFIRTVASSWGGSLWGEKGQ